MRKIALATSSDYSDLPKDERLVLNMLLDWGVDVEPLVWDSQDSTWKQFDAVFIRSCWDYHLKLDAFFEWIERLEKEEIQVFNSPETLRWNSRKTYLRDISEKGIQVVPTLWVSRGQVPRLADILQEQGWTRAVVKPVVSANAFETWLTSPQTGQADQERLEKMVDEHGDVMIQKFISEITANGEWSFIFFENRYSHSVWKQPSSGDFRVQEDLGATVSGKRPPRQLLEQAQQIVEKIGCDCVYARVDAVPIEGALVLMELELMEPSLYLDRHPRAPARFAEAILARLRALHNREHSESMMPVAAGGNS